MTAFSFLSREALEHAAIAYDAEKLISLRAASSQRWLQDGDHKAASRDAAEMHDAFQACALAWKRAANGAVDVVTGRKR